MIYSTENNIIPITIYNDDGYILPTVDANLDNVVTLDYSWYRYNNRTMIYLLFAQKTSTLNYTIPSLFSTCVYYL